MRIIAKKTLRTFWARHKDSEQPLKAWYNETREARWRNTADIRRHYPSASFLHRNRVVFNIKGNHYRLVVRVNYDYGIVWIRFIGTHAAYDAIDATTI